MRSTGRRSSHQKVKLWTPNAKLKTEEHREMLKTKSWQKKARVFKQITKMPTPKGTVQLSKREMLSPNSKSTPNSPQEILQANKELKPRNENNNDKQNSPKPLWMTAAGSTNWNSSIIALLELRPPEQMRDAEGEEKKSLVLVTLHTDLVAFVETRER